MKIKRFVAKDMRTALTNIKEELGADAVIMSNKKIAGGVELMAAVDYSQVTPEPQISKEAASKEHKNSATVEREIESDVVSLGGPKNTPILPPKEEQPAADSLQALLARQENVKNQINAQPDQNENDASISQGLKSLAEKLAFHNNSEPESKPLVDSENVDSAYSEESDFATPVNKVDAVSKKEFEGVKSELSLIRELLEHQVSGLMWQDIARKEPIRALLVKKLLAMGLTSHVADQLACFIPEDTPEKDGWTQVMEILAGQVTTTNNDILHRGGVVSLVGPTGVGKTTTIAKLAARCAQMHGTESVALISTDTYRVAGFEQLQTYGKIIGCPVKLAKDNEELNSLLSKLKDKKLVLIDTAGLGQRDMRLNKQLSYLVNKANVKIKNYLVLAANTQQAVMNESVAQFKQIPLAGCIFTKLDECLSLGEIISTAIQNALPIGYLTDGQRVPEDIKVANAQKLVKAAEKLAENSSDDYDWMPLVANNSAMI